jgi:hypothetical protein
VMTKEGAIYESISGKIERSKARAFFIQAS